MKKIFKEEVDELAHNKFTRYGKGEYERFFIYIKKGKDLKLKTSLANCALKPRRL